MAESYVPSLWVCEILTYEHTFCPRTEPSDLSLAVDLMKKLSFSISVTTSLSHTCRFNNTPPTPFCLMVSPRAITLVMRHLCGRLTCEPNRSDCSLKGSSICRGPKMKASVTPSGQEIDFIFISSSAVRFILISILKDRFSSGNLTSDWYY